VLVAALLMVAAICAPTSAIADQAGGYTPYTGSVTLTTNRATVDASNTRATLTATLSQPLPYPYAVSLYDDRGRDMSSCYANYTPPTVCEFTDIVDVGATRTYTAYIAQDHPGTGSGPPVVDVRGTSSVSVRNIDPSAYLDAIAVAGMAVSADEACLPLNQLRTPADQGSVSQAFTACEAMAQGASLNVALAWIAAHYGPDAVRLVYAWLYSGTHAADGGLHPLPPYDPAHPPTYSDRAYPVPSGLELVPQALVENVARDIEARPDAQKSPSLRNNPSLVRAVAQACLQQSARMMFEGDGWVTRNPCGTSTIFFPGTAAEAAANHDEDVIMGNPTLMRLNYMSRTAKRASGILPTWKDPDPACAARSAIDNTACDEYPFYSSEQGGPGADLMVIDADENSSEGGSLGSMTTTCLLKSATPSPAVGQANHDGDHYLVVPVARLGLPTAFVCGSLKGP